MQRTDYSYLQSLDGLAGCNSNPFTRCGRMPGVHRHARYLRRPSQIRDFLTRCIRHDRVCHYPLLYIRSG
jgi:hypothetical protein